MNPLLFADWGKINRMLCFIMWVVALILVLVIIAHSDGNGYIVHHAHRPLPR